MPPKKSPTDEPVTLTFKEFLDAEPPNYRQYPSNWLTTFSSVDEQSTTCQWAKDRLSLVSLDKKQWIWQTDPTYLQFQRAIDKESLKVLVVQEIPFEYPRNEADVAIAIEAQVLQPIWHIGKSWIPNPKICRATSGIQWKSELLNEAYMKSSSAQPSEPLDDTIDGPADLQYQLRLRSATVTSDTPVHINTRSTMGGVRVDKIYALSYQGHNGAFTRLGVKSQTGMEAFPVHSSNQYLKRGKMWCIQGVKAEDHLKALLPVELKRDGYIQESLMEEIAKREYVLGTFNRMTPRSSSNHAGVRMTVAILQQAIRYGDHYGARFVMATTYRASIILDLQSIGDLKSRKTNPDIEDKTLRWAFVDAKHVRHAFAYIFWFACQTVRKELVEYEKTTEATQE